MEVVTTDPRNPCDVSDVFSMIGCSQGGGHAPTALSQAAGGFASGAAATYDASTPAPYDSVAPAIYDGAPAPYDGTPAPYDGAPAPYDGAPAAYDPGAPSTFDHTTEVSRSSTTSSEAATACFYVHPMSPASAAAAAMPNSYAMPSSMAMSMMSSTMVPYLDQGGCQADDGSGYLGNGAQSSAHASVLNGQPRPCAACRTAKVRCDP